MNFKRYLCGLLAFVICALQFNVSASVLGSSKIDGYTIQIGQGIDFTHNVFYSDQSGVGKQTENYITYTPNEDVLPIITNGNKIWGTTTISKEVARLEESGLNIIGGTNADFFSLQTGVGMSNLIIDGKILTKDASGQDAIGIMPDGTAFVSYFSLNSVLTKEDGSEVNIYNINKYRQPYAAYLFTSDFSTHTHNETFGYDIVLGSIEGELKLGTKLTAIVESIIYTDESREIPEDKLIISIDEKAPAEFLEPLCSLQEGEKVTLSLSATGDDRWSGVSLGLGSVGGRLLINGQVNPNLPSGASPRTAIGIKEDSTLVLYTIDGRQTGHSYGVQLKTLANRMKELGCVEALNLDGGGSTQIAVQLPGSESLDIVNKPSDGRERGVSSFIFFKSTKERTGILDKLFIYPLTGYVLKGASLDITVKATDSAFYPVKAPSNTKFSVEEGKSSTISASGKFVARDNGLVTIYAKSGDIETSLAITCLETPTDIIVKDQSSGQAVSSLNLEPEAMVSLTAEAYGGYNRLTATDEDFVWSTRGEIGKISSDGTFLASDVYGAQGNILVTAGEKTITIPVHLAAPDSSDPAAYPIIDAKINDDKFFGQISSGYNILTEKEGITIKVDGKAVDFEYDKDTGEFKGDLNPQWRKLTIFASNIFGHQSFKYIESDNPITPAPFSDTEGHWASDVLGFLYSAKIISGDMTDGTLKFNPQKPMTRSEFAVMVTNYLGVNKEDYKDVLLPYSDLDKVPFWALDSFKVLYKEGILKGRYVSETESCADPLSTISRAEAATIVGRMQPKGLLITKIDAPDKDDIPTWAEDQISTLITLGAMKGYEDKTIRPLNTLTKAEAAKILYSTM